jgi:hypothetical protein
MIETVIIVVRRDTWVTIVLILVAVVSEVVGLVEPLVVPIEEVVEAMEGGVVAVPGVEVVVTLVLMLQSLKIPPQSPWLGNKLNDGKNGIREKNLSVQPALLLVLWQLHPPSTSVTLPTTPIRAQVLRHKPLHLHVEVIESG